jgi:hypothetical protein
MAGFAKFDPHAFLIGEQQAAANAGLTRTTKDASHPASNPKTLATLAALAASSLQYENQDVEQSSATSGSQPNGENRESEPAPAKVAKVAKVEPSIAAEDDALWGEREEERAAIAEYDGGAPRVWAEALARLDPARAPCDIPPKRWLRFIDDCGVFLDDGWATCAEALGWGRLKPFARTSRAGLLWSLDGRRLLALSADAAAIATPGGGNQKYRRCMREPGGVLAWSLCEAVP